MFVIMFSSFSNSLTFWLFGNLEVRYALWLSMWSGIVISIFLYFIQKIIKIFGRQSIIIFILSGVILLATIMLPTVNTLNMIAKAKVVGNLWSVNKLCR